MFARPILSRRFNLGKLITQRYLHTFIEVDFCVMVLTLVPSVFLGLEIGILIGIVVNLMALLYFSARPSVQTQIEQVQ